MADKTPLRLVLDGSNNPTGLAEFQSGETIGNAFLTNSSFTLVDDSSSTTNISLGEALKISGGSGIDTAISGDTLTISLESTIVTETSTDTLTNKSISLSTNTITGTLAEFNTAVSDADFASLAGSETLTNKTISGSSNTLSNIGNSSLTNSSFTLADDTSSTTTINLGETLKISGDTGITTSVSGDNINIDLDDTAVTPNTYGSSTAVPVITIDQQGRITSASTQNISTTLTISDDTSSTVDITLGSDTLKVSGTSNEIETSISGDTITIGLPSNVTIGNNLIVTGDLTVNGTTTTINSTTLSVDDKNIELASVLTPTDVTADGAGITIKGATDKTFNWLDATDSFTSSEHIDLASTKVFKINNSTVLSSTQVLGKSVPSGTIVGTSDSQTLTNKTISGSDNTITNISNSSLTNSSFTIVDDSSTTSTISLGEALLLAGGTGITSVISGDTVTFNIDSTVTTLTDTQTLTNKTISGSSNTLSNIDNGSLTNSSITLSDDSSSTTTISLGETLKLSGDTGITTTISGDTVNIDLDDTAVSPGSYGSSTAVPVIAVDQQGRITSVSTQNISTTLTISDDSSTLANINLGSDTLKISGTANEIETSISGDTIIVGLPNNVTVAGTLDVNGASTLKGSITLGQNSGDSTEDSITVNARFISNLEPLHNITYDLGSPNRRWRDLYLSGNTIDLNGATISGDGSGNITISATGAVLPAGSQVGTQSIATADPNTGISTRVVPLFTQASGLATVAKDLIFKSGNETAQLIFTDFTVSTGANIVANNSGGTLFAF
jgi:hypothetical protein